MLTDVTVTGIKIEYWQTTDPINKLTHILLGTQTAVRLAGFAPLTKYSFRATVIPDPARPTLWSQEVIVESADEEFEIDTEEIANIVSVGNEWGFANLNVTQDRLDYLASIVADGAALIDGFIQIIKNYTNHNT
ncbi:hypothetical protein [Bartonella tamiae]|uniref:Fibronectin type-III domain-containing protein n=1 Tax=Bartonella tamiae Th239 TaxID=1094558 RepID=J1K1Y4_9HYPH|nr:hypothetical protein [Bartonella tamiae]EJF91095.1 hypothetical protein ME5_00427 [Bartonella tamiae Th239]EJF93240.1 hypothetical protein MEG_01454 [Bartonella tamiae Th307]